MPGRFTAIPAVPTGLNEWQNQLSNTMKENVELLCGIRDAKLILNVQELANDVAYLRSVVNTMIVQLKG